MGSAQRRGGARMALPTHRRRVCRVQDSRSASLAVPYALRPSPPLLALQDSGTYPVFINVYSVVSIFEP